MKIAHLILCHANPPQLQRLTERLAYDGDACYIHLDKKSDITPCLPLADMPNLFFIKNREKVSWGGYSIVQATINGFVEIIETGIPYDYINLLSGQDYPLLPLSELHSFLEANTGKAFMHTLSVLNEWHEAIPRLTKYHMTHLDFPGKHKVELIVNKILPQRTMPAGLEAVGRSQWFTIPVACAVYITNYIKANKRVERFFKFTWAPDEIIFQTILHNSPFREVMVNDNLRYIDWSAGGASPKVLTMDDKETLMTSGKFFARKFNPDVDQLILDYLDIMIAKKSGI